MERDCESELSKLNIEQNACIYHFGASVIHGQRSNILRLRKAVCYSMKRCESGGQYQAPQPRRHAGRMREAPSTERSPLRLLWQTENKSQRI